MQETAHGWAQPCVKWLTPRSRNESPVFEPVSQRLACYDGELDAEHGRQLIEWLLAHPHSTLVIRSPGGPVTAGLPIGKAILASRAAVAAFQVCASSCANYVFGASRRRVILRDTLVLFHGGVSPNIIERAEQQVRKQLSAGKFAEKVIGQAVRSVRMQLEQQLNEQRQLLTEAGVDAEFLERFDALSDNDLSQARCTDRQEAAAVYLTKEQFRKLGMPVHGFVIASRRDATRVLKQLKSARSVCAAPDKIVGR